MLREISFYTVLLLAPALAHAEQRQPNVMVILADDLGYGELGYQGNDEIPTPHIDELARSGVRCTAAYVTGPNCSPSRAGLLTGRTRGISLCPRRGTA